MKVLFIADVAKRLETEHSISLTLGALRKHLSSAKKPLEPILHGELTSIGVWAFTPANVDRFASAYKSAQEGNNRLGKSGRKRKG